MNRFPSLVFATALLAAGSLSLPLRAATEADATAGRALVKRYADAIVSVELVVTLKLKMGNQERPQEQKIEVNGTVISSNGLTVTSLAEVDPQSMLEVVRAANPGGRGPEIVGSEFKEVKLRLADGKEVPARFVLKDQDLDLAFMAPDVPADGAKVEFPAVVKLDEPAEGAVLGTYFYISRASKALQRVPLVRTSEVVGVVEKPRKFYLMTDVTVGCPLVDAKGKVLGITLNNFTGGRRASVVLPAADIAEMAKQAAAAQAKPAPEAEPKKEN